MGLTKNRSDTSTVEPRRFAKPERDQRVGCAERRQAARLIPPEGIIVDQVGHLLVQRSQLAGRDTGAAQPLQRFGSQILELNPLCVSGRCWIGCHVDGHAGRAAMGEQPAHLGPVRYIGMQHGQVPGMTRRVRRSLRFPSLAIGPNYSSRSRGEK
jgi:hypothetical protein